MTPPPKAETPPTYAEGQAYSHSQASPPTGAAHVCHAQPPTVSRHTAQPAGYADCLEPTA